MKDKLKNLNQLNQEIKDLYIPIFYRLSNSKDRKELEELININSAITVHDELIGQLEELVKSQNPKIRFTKEALTEAAINYLGNTPAEEYGVWVYYPWAMRLVHILDEEEFVFVRTNRNQYKITPAEEDILATKKIGVIGLSVGKAIALTIAMERICGELRIADFDVIELSNLNRIQTGVQNFGVKKTIVVAREIAEIDPYLKVTLFSDGLTEENVDDFFLKNGKLDVCIEVCDGLYTKIFSRQKAKTYGVPVVMNSSDRGTTDIERYDTDPEMPLLHGLIDHLDLNLVKQAKTNEEKVPYLLPMLGVDTSSSRLKASMLEIEETITTWPQLASGVILGGGICTDVCRRILLNQFTKSGRYFVDTEDLINDSTIDFIEQNKQQEKQFLVMPNATIKNYSAVLQEFDSKNYVSSSSVELNKEQLYDLLNSAILAPSGGNVQPWSWLYKNKSLLLFHDKQRSESILNYKNTAAFIALGAATENLILKAHSLKLDVVVNTFPLGADSELIAVFDFNKLAADVINKNSIHDELVVSIPKRMANRTLGIRVRLNSEDENYLINVVKYNSNADLKLINSDETMNELKKIIAEVDRLFLTNKTGSHHFNNEIRWSREEADVTKDGVDLATIDITPTEHAGLVVSKEADVTKYIKDWNLGEAFGKHAKKSIDSASALGLITMPKSHFQSYFDAGRIIERAWLGATHKGIAFQPMSVLTFLFARINDGNYDHIEDIKDQLIDLNKKFRHIFKLKDNEKEVFFFKLSIADEPKMRSLRKNIEDVLIHE